MKKWIISAVLYLGLVVGGYTAYAEWIKEEEKPVVHEGEHQETAANVGESTEDHGNAHQQESSSEHEEEEGDHSHDGNTEVKDSEVKTTLEYKNSMISIGLEDQSGKPVTELEVNHEKLLHLIVVNEHLDKYYHLHPEQTGDGKFSIEKELPEGNYKAFIDIKPKNASYTVNPLPFVVGTPDHGHEESLKADSSLTQKVEDKTVTLNMTSQEANKPVTLTFDLDKTKLETYLGAMGHVVILDEKAEKYVHVHPANHDEPIFETKFDQPGIYKIWAEFKQDGKVRVFPFVVEIK